MERNHFRAFAGAFHVRDFLRPLVNQQDEQIRLRVVFENRIGDFLHQHRFAGARRRDDEAARAFANRANQIQNPRAQFVRRGFQNEPLVRKQRREVVEMRFFLRLVRIFGVHGLDLEQREKFFLLLRRADLPGDEISGLQIKTADLRRRNVNILRAGQIIETLRPQKAEAFRQNFQHALRKQHARALGVFLEDVENDLVLAHRAEIFHAQFPRHAVQFRHAHRLQFGDVQRRGDFVALITAPLLGCSLASSMTGSTGVDGGCNSGEGSAKAGSRRRFPRRCRRWQRRLPRTAAASATGVSTASAAAALALGFLLGFRDSCHKLKIKLVLAGLAGILVASRRHGRKCRHALDGTRPEWFNMDFSQPGIRGICASIRQRQCRSQFTGILAHFGRMSNPIFQNRCFIRAGSVA